MTNDLWAEIEQSGPTEPFDWQASLTELERRPAWLDKYSWAVPSRKAIDAIVSFAAGDKILEVGAGLGLWSKLLTMAGATVITTDAQPGQLWKRSAAVERYAETFTEVEKANALEAVIRHRDCRVLFLCWPPYGTPMAYLALREFKGDRLVYVGEPDGGCTGDEKFHSLIRKRWRDDKVINIPQWPLVHDYMGLFRRRRWHA